MASTSVAIRPADHPDVEELAELHRQATGDGGRLADLRMAQVDGRLLVAERDQEIVGYATYGRFFAYDFIELLVVRPRDRRTGVATALVAAIESMSRTGKLFTSTNRSNVAMQRLCANLGFLPSGVVENLDEGDPELFFVKRLKGTSSVRATIDS
jgi:GNAT superfamily N-acetyltransferase